MRLPVPHRRGISSLHHRMQCPQVSAKERPEVLCEGGGATTVGQQTDDAVVSASPFVLLAQSGPHGMPIGVSFCQWELCCLPPTAPYASVVQHTLCCASSVYMSCWSMCELREAAADCAASGQPPAEPALRRRSGSLQGAASTLVPNVALGMSPPTVVVSGSSAATRAASQDMGGFRRLSVRGGQAETDEVELLQPPLSLQQFLSFDQDP